MFFRAAFPNPAGLLHSGGAGNVLIPRSEDNVLVIHQAATYELQDKIFVYRIEDGVAPRLSAEASVMTLQKQVRTQENSLSALLGLMPQHIERGTLKGQMFPDSMAVGVPLQILERRPDVKQAEYALAQAFYSTNAARSAFYPSITLSGSAGWTNTAGNIITNPGNWLLSAIGSLVQPLFNRGTNIANLRIAKAQQEEALLSFRQSLLKDELAAAGDRFDRIQGVINLYHALGGGAVL